MKLVSLHAELFFEPYGDRGHPIGFRLTLTDQTPLRLRIGGSGQMLIIDHEALDAPYSWEGGRTEHQDVVGLLSPRLRDMVVDRIEALCLSGDQVGLTLVSPQWPAFHLWVDGDEFFWGNDQSLSWHWNYNDAAPRLAGQIMVKGR